jgi:hypothetical protein
MLMAKRSPGTERLCIKTALSRLISVDVRSTRFFFSINADRLLVGVKNGVLPGYCINSSSGKAKYFVIWVGMDGIIGKAGLVQ